MIINQITFKNFKLLKNVVLNFNKINIIKGENASGKSSILNGIILSLYGEGSRINLVKLVSFGSKSAEITIETDRFTVIRRIPTDLIINQNNVEVKLNTSTIKQNWINDQIGTYDFFRKYRLFNKQAVNLLDLGIISLRKELMTFIDTDFSTIRQSLLNKKLERENLNVNKKLYKFYLSEKRLQILNAGLDSIKTSYLEFEKDRDTQNGIVNQLKTEIQTRERMIYNRKRELEEAQKSGICPILKTKCTQITRQITPEQQSKMNHEIEQLFQEIEQYKFQLDTEMDGLSYYDASLKRLQSEENKARNCLIKLKEAQKFSDYKYTASDVQLYEDAKKTWDNFAGWYIQEWLDNLTFIINDLLKDMDMSVSFSADKTFITITNEGQEMDYESLSSGQQTFLNVIFKLAVLLNNGINEGVVMLDEMINTLNFNSLNKLLIILKTLNFQFFLIYQNIPENIEDVNYINIERKNGESTIK